MNSFAPTEQRLDAICRRYRAFPRVPAILARLIRHDFKLLHDQANAALKPWRINHAEYSLLMTLYGATDGMTPSQLGDSTSEKLANVTRLTDSLYEKGLLGRSRSRDDRRKIALSLSRKGIALAEDFLPTICALLKQQTSTLSATEQAQLERLLKKMLAGLDKAEA